jgi:alpha-ribazole phosphatase
VEKRNKTTRQESILTKILLVRHGITKLHTRGRFWGKTDIPLSNAGIKQAGQLRNRLATERIDAIYSSTQSRARSTAEIIASGHEVDVTACEELCECNFGYIEGLDYEEIKRLYPPLAEELSNWQAVSFPGGESLKQLNARVKVFLKRLEKHKAKETVLIVAHGGPLRLIVCNLLGLGLDFWLKIRIDLASLSIVEAYPQTTILSLLNDVSHLKPQEEQKP